jgi:hypothetical protein
VNLVLSLVYLALGDVILDGGLRKVKHSSSIVVDCVLYNVLEMLLVFDHLSPLSNTPGCVAVIKSSEDICKDSLALSLQLCQYF